jgi:hypothetical protein
LNGAVIEDDGSVWVLWVLWVLWVFVFQDNVEGV